MKVTEAKKSNSAQNRIQAKREPFFLKEGKGTFFSKSNKATTSFFSPTGIQPKLTIGQPNDKYEIEADTMADKVVQRLSDPTSVEPTSNVVQTKCATCDQEEKLQKKEEKDILETEEEIHTKISTADTSTPPDDEGNIQTKPRATQREALSDLQSRLSSSKGKGSPLSADIKSSMGSAFGVNFSEVRVHTDSSAVQMNKDLGAQAFTNGNDIYFNEGKYNTSSNSGKHLLAHELTHTIQQKGSSGLSQRKIQLLPDWVNDAASWVGDTASDVAGNVVEGAEWVGGQVADGARWVGGKVASGAEWVGDQISEAAQWIIDRIRSVINSGTTYLNEKWENIQEFGRTCFDDIKNGFGNLVHFVTIPLSGLMHALSGMNVDLFTSIWSLVKTGANALWLGINSVINSVLQIGEGIWNTVSGFMNGIFETIDGLFDNSAFNLLPDWIKTEARSIFNGLRSLWNRVSAFWADLWQRLTSTIQEILVSIRSFVDNIISYGIGTVIYMIRNLKEVYDYVTELFADPRATIQPFIDQLAGMINAEAPGRANNIGTNLAQENYPGGAPQTSNGHIQRSGGGGERTTATLEEVAEGILYYIAKSWQELDIKQMLWDTVVNMFWPPATIRAIFNQFSQLWNDDWATTVDSLYTPRNFFDDPIGSLHDIWSNFMILLDFPMALWRTLNSVVGLLMGYITIIVVLVEAIAGAVVGSAAGGVGAIPGFLAGAQAGLATMAALGEALMASFLLAESGTVIIILTRLFTARQLCEKRQVDILTSVASFITMAVALILQFLMALLAELVTLIANFLKGASKGAPVPRPVPEPQPRPQPQPQPRPQPQPANPGGGEVIPFPGRPATPAVPDRIAAKFEEGTNESHITKALREENNLSSIFTDEPHANQESDYDAETVSLSNVLNTGNGTIQTARKDQIDPEKCDDDEDCEKPYKWTRNNQTVPGNMVLRYCEKDKNNFTKHGHHSWPKYIGGPEVQTLMPVDQNIHLGEYHGNQGPIGGIHTYLTGALNADPVYGSFLGSDSIERNTSGSGNQKLIKAMSASQGNDANLRRTVKNKLMAYYKYYKDNSDPVMPTNAYSQGLRDSVNNIA